MPYEGLSLQGQTALVTGSGRGIGAALAVGLAQAGADVAVSDRLDRLDLAEETKDKVKAEGVKSAVYALDVLDLASMPKTIDQIVNDFGRLDILVNNAGIRIPKPALEVTEEDWDVTIDINLKGVFFCAQAAGRHMVSQGYGRIINLGSQLSEVASRGRSSYCASKFGVAGITKVMAVEWAPHGVTVNAIGPGPTSTPGMIAASNRTDEEVQADLDAHLPLGRRMDPSEMVGAVIYLASKSSAGTTGHLLMVDGGWTAI